MFINAGARLLCTSDGVCVIVYVQFSSVGAGMVWGVGSSLHSGIEFGRSRTGIGVFGGEEEGLYEEWARSGCEDGACDRV